MLNLERKLELRVSICALCNVSGDQHVLYSLFSAMLHFTTETKVFFVLLEKTDCDALFYSPYCANVPFEKQYLSNGQQNPHPALPVLCVYQLMSK